MSVRFDRWREIWMMLNPAQIATVRANSREPVLIEEFSMMQQSEGRIRYGSMILKTGCVSTKTMPTNRGISSVVTDLVGEPIRLLQKLGSVGSTIYAGQLAIEGALEAADVAQVASIASNMLRSTETVYDKVNALVACCTSSFLSRQHGTR